MGDKLCVLEWGSSYLWTVIESLNNVNEINLDIITLDDIQCLSDLTFCLFYFCSFNHLSFSPLFVEPQVPIYFFMIKLSMIMICFHLVDATVIIIYLGCVNETLIKRWMGNHLRSTPPAIAYHLFNYIIEINCQKTRLISWQTMRCLTQNGLASGHVLSLHNVDTGYRTCYGYTKWPQCYIPSYLFTNMNIFNPSMNK